MNRVLKHLRSAHDEVGVVLLLENDRPELYARQLEFDLFDNGSLGTVRGITLAKCSLLWRGCLMVCVWESIPHEEMSQYDYCDETRSG